MLRTVTLIPGDSVGAETASAMRRLVRAAGVDISWEEMPAGVDAYERLGSPMPAETIESVRRNGYAIKGRIMTPVGEGYESPNLTLRKALNLFAGVRPLRHFPGVPSRYQDVDVVVIRESTEDVYAGIEHRVYPGVIQGLRVTTRTACERIVRFAFEYARRNGRAKVTLVHKANILKMSDGLFLRVGHELSASYPDIAFDAIIADNACMQMVRNPTRFDVLVCQNLFGDLLSDLGAGLVGGIAAVWGSMRNDQGTVVFEAIHGIAPSLEGKGIANPMTFIMPALALLRELGEIDAARNISQAMGDCLLAGVSTPDFGGSETTESFVDAVIARLPKG
ncbi:MAG: isocitrate/isopropylmalate dehydrogenase family protein [Deltaproteobacteria bacterium]|nr:isocitrate/isopropylmalate dehydrogenase family protein [Deltaproteobacteria bacterium]MCB9785775.1 isocitrate/isopropylmalate dehydrogenase family protein [Deltaproteobacteria bacterium]